LYWIGAKRLFQKIAAWIASQDYSEEKDSLYFLKNLGHEYLHSFITHAIIGVFTDSIISFPHAISTSFKEKSIAVPGPLDVTKALEMTTESSL
jgi:hypothetical protein